MWLKSALQPDDIYVLILTLDHVGIGKPDETGDVVYGSIGMPLGTAGCLLWRALAGRKTWTNRYFLGKRRAGTLGSLICIWIDSYPKEQTVVILIWTESSLWRWWRPIGVWQKCYGDYSIWIGKVAVSAPSFIPQLRAITSRSWIHFSLQSWRFRHLHRVRASIISKRKEYRESSSDEYVPKVNYHKLWWICTKSLDLDGGIDMCAIALRGRSKPSHSDILAKWKLSGLELFRKLE